MVSVIEVKEEDIFLFQVDVGQMPPARANDYLNKMRDTMKIDFGNKMIFLAVRNGNGTELTILRKI